MKTRGFKLLVFVLFFLFLFQVASLLYLRKPAKGGSLTSVSDTLSNSRLSFVAAEDAGNSVGSSLVRIKLVGDSPPGWATTVKNFNLFPGETVTIGDKVDYEVVNIIDDSNDDLITVTPDLESGDAGTDMPVIATASARHTVVFTTASDVADGVIRIRIAAAANGGSDGTPDKLGFDFGPIVNGDVTCPTGGGAVDIWEPGTATASGGTGCASGYHCFECRYSGTLEDAQTLTMYIGGAAAADQLINPAPSSTTRTIGEANYHAFIVDHLGAQPDYTLVDTTTGKVTVQEAVRVTATVEPILELTIAGIGVGTTACGLPADVTTEAAVVPFGTLSITDFIAAQQKLTISTNADGGYTVTLIENDQLGKDGTTAPYIPDSTGDGNNMDHDTKGDWDDPSISTSKGFGYSLEEASGCSGATYCSADFEYDDSDGLCTSTTYCGKHFAATADGGESAQTMFSSTDVASSEDVYICYKIVASATQDAGDYENYITFVATATF